MNVVLIGFASCGKSTTAKALCNRTGMRCVDLDRVIEDRYEKIHGRRMSCRDIFKDVGLNGFCELENDALRSLSHIQNTVLSTGGRTPIHKGNQPLLKSMGSIIYLRCGAEAALKRMGSKGFPMSMGGTEAGVKEAWNRRDPIYSELADIIIDNDELTPNDTAQIIIEKVAPPTSQDTSALRR